MRVDPRLQAWHTYLHCGTKPLMDGRLSSDKVGLRYVSFCW